MNTVNYLLYAAAAVVGTLGALTLFVFFVAAAANGPEGSTNPYLWAIALGWLATLAGSAALLYFSRPFTASAVAVLPMVAFLAMMLWLAVSQALSH